MPKDAHTKAANTTTAPPKAIGWLPINMARASTQRDVRKPRRPKPIRRRRTNTLKMRTARAEHTLSELRKARAHRGLAFRASWKTVGQRRPLTAEISLLGRLLAAVPRGKAAIRSRQSYDRGTEGFGSHNGRCRVHFRWRSCG
jgi:hypothetical protein